MNDQLFIPMLESLGISELILLYYNEKTSEEIKSLIYDIVSNRNCKYQIFNQNEIFYYELAVIAERLENQNFIFKISSTPYDLFSFFFNYLKNNDIENALLDELIIARYFQGFIKLELKNIENRLIQDDDINSKKTLLKIKKIYEEYSQYEYEDIYLYLYSTNPNFYRNKSKIDSFIKKETNLMKIHIQRLQELIKSGNHLVDYEQAEIYHNLEFKEGKILKFIQKK